MAPMQGASSATGPGKSSLVTISDDEPEGCGTDLITLSDKFEESKEEQESSDLVYSVKLVNPAKKSDY